MKSFCPECQAYREIYLIHTAETITFHGEPIRVNVRYRVCKVCKTRFTTKDDPDPMPQVYAEYSRRLRSKGDDNNGAS